jgi:hypothetical protein
VIAAALFVPVAAGQLVTRVTGPVIGYVWDAQQHQIRPLQGVLGSATIGDPVDLGIDIDDALELGASRLLLTSRGTAPLFAVDLSTNPPSVEEVAWASSAPALAASSPGGTAAALYDQPAHTIAIVTGLPAAPRVAHRVEVLQLNASVTTMAVSDDGETLVYAVSGGVLTSLFSWTPASGLRALIDTSAVSALALAGKALVVANPRDDEVFLMPDFAGSPRRRTLAGPDQGISRPVGLAAAANGTRVHVANGGSSNVTTFELAGRQVSSRRCNCQISGLSRVGDSIYRLTDRLDRTVFLFDARSAESRILFVPPIS